MTEARGGVGRGGAGGPLGAQAMARGLPGDHGLDGAFGASGMAGRLKRIVQVGKDPKGGKCKPWKALVALGLVGAGVWAMLDDSFSLSTEHAVVSAYTFGLRSPIAGQVAGLRASPGAEVAAGAPLATVEDARADPQRLQELRGQRNRVRADRLATAAQRDALAGMRDELATRAAAHRAVALTWYGAQLTEAERLLAAAEARALRDRQTLDRKTRLLATGFATRADVDLAQADHSVSAHAVEAQAGRVAALRAQREGAAQGVFVDTGQSGSPYAQQRSDEIRLRMAELDRLVLTLAAEEASLSARLESETAHMALLSSATLPAPAGGVVWRVLANEGERVAVGDTVAEVMDCSAAFVLAAVPQDRAAEVKLGGLARFRLAGESRDRTGRVLAVLAEGAVGTAERNLAAQPTRPPHGAALVRVALAPPAEGEAGGCPVGRSARLLLPTKDGGLLGRAVAALH